MASIISAGTSSGTALNMTGDTSGNLAFQTQAGANTISVPNATGTMIYKDSNGTTTLNSNSSQAPLIAQINGTEVSRIDSSGNFCLGTASATGQINVVTPANTKTELYMLKTSQVEAHIGFKSSTDSNWYFGTTGTLGGAGVYQANGSNGWSAVSDETLKTDLTPILDGLNKVASLRAVTGRYKTDPEGKSRSFLIAQDVQKVLPEAISIADPETGALGLGYTDVIPLLVAAIKELKAEIELLKGN